MKYFTEETETRDNMHRTAASGHIAFCGQPAEKETGSQSEKGRGS